MRYLNNLQKQNYKGKERIDLRIRKGFKPINIILDDLDKFEEKK